MSLSARNIECVITGDKLLEAMQKSTQRRKPIASGFLYEQTITMLFADPGVGKSTVSAQIAVELAAGLPIFGLFAVPEPVKVLYVQMERSILELTERFELLRETYPIIKENLYVTDAYQPLNLVNESHVAIMIECIKRDCPDAKVMFFDPIYCMISGGLKEDGPASAFTRAMSNVQKTFKSCLIYNHHTIKPQSDNKGRMLDKDDTSYGSRWIKAHTTGSFLMSDVNNGDGVLLTRKKDNYGLLPPKIKLDYNPETGICTVPPGEVPAPERVKNFIRLQKMTGKEFDLKDIMGHSQVSRRTVEDLILRTTIKDAIIYRTVSKGKKLYKTIGDV